MDRRRFLTATGAFLGLIGVGYPLEAKNDNRKSQKDAPDPAEKTKPPLLPFVPGSWTIVVMPDTQHYALSYPGVLRLQTDWISENRDENKIVYVLQNGDITHTRTLREWNAASRAFEILDGKVPYALVPGNHDYSYVDKIRQRESQINDFFPPSRFEKWPTFGGTMDRGHIENNYHLFEAGGKNWVIIGLEWAPRDIALEWAGKLLEKNADRKAIILTHAYLYNDSTRYDWAKKGESQKWNPHLDNTVGGTNDGEEIWQKLVKKHPNVALVVNGHVLGDGLGFQVSRGDHGNRVNEMLVNYQMLEVGGGGWLRLLEFLPDGKTVQARTYSPLYDEYRTDPQNQFTFEID